MTTTVSSQHQLLRCSPAAVKSSSSTDSDMTSTAQRHFSAWNGGRLVTVSRMRFSPVSASGIHNSWLGPKPRTLEMSAKSTPIMDDVFTQLQ